MPNDRRVGLLTFNAGFVRESAPAYPEDAPEAVVLRELVGSFRACFCMFEGEILTDDVGTAILDGILPVWKRTQHCGRSHS